MNNGVNPLVTVVTPSYNQGHFIRQTIESVLSQDYPAIEYIIMDGGSRDETATVVKDYASRLTFLSERDRGQSHAINKGFHMARGSIVSWLNSDDLYLPGAVRAAVDGFRRDPTAGAVYGEGYLIDRLGEITSRFPCTEPLNLWKLVHLSDYILQQTTYFRKDVLDDVGYLDDRLHYAMDWDILIRIGMKYPLTYIPKYMGCLREYPEAKSFAGGSERIRELRAMLQRHTRMLVPPGYIVYGLDTYHQIWCARIEELLTPALRPLSSKIEKWLREFAARVIGRTIREAQGLYVDGWAARRLRYMLPPGHGHIIVEGHLPDWDALRGQVLRVRSDGRCLGEFPLSAGEFRLTIEVPTSRPAKLINLDIVARRWIVLGRLPLHGDRRPLAYQLKAIRWSE